MGRIGAILDAPVEIRDEDPLDIDEVQGAVVFRALTFAYDGPAVLHDINLEIPKQRVTAFIGPSGCGKTTVARVLAMALNCPNRTEEGEPCGTCESCARIWSGHTSLDVIEIEVEGAWQNQPPLDRKTSTEDIKLLTFFR